MEEARCQKLVGGTWGTYDLARKCLKPVRWKVVVVYQTHGGDERITEYVCTYHKNQIVSRVEKLDTVSIASLEKVKVKNG